MIKRIKLYYINKKINKLNKSIDNITDIINDLKRHIHDVSDINHMIHNIRYYERILACDKAMLNSYNQDKERLER